MKEQSAPPLFTCTFDIRIIKIELASGKTSILLFISLKYDALFLSIFPMFYVEDFY